LLQLVLVDDPDFVSLTLLDILICDNFCSTKQHNTQQMQHTLIQELTLENGWKNGHIDRYGMWRSGYDLFAPPYILDFYGKAIRTLDLYFWLSDIQDLFVARNIDTGQIEKQAECLLLKCVYIHHDAYFRPSLLRPPALLLPFDLA